MAKQSRNRVKLEKHWFGRNKKGGCQQRPQSRLPDLSVNRLVVAPWLLRGCSVVAP